MSFFAYSAGAPFLKDGKLKPIAIATEERSPLTPDIPTFKELGMPGVIGEAGSRCSHAPTRRSR